jgi:hypothetical protein
MTDNQEPRPSCFGDLNTVFPMRSDGFRATPIACLQCALKTECLRSAMGRKGGLTVREEMIDRAYRGGLVGFIQRWSSKKNIHRLKNCATDAVKEEDHG